MRRDPKQSFKVARTSRWAASTRAGHLVAPARGRCPERPMHN
jgi:hypothetical protein